jgi:hypothetical protein
LEGLIERNLPFLWLYHMKIAHYMWRCHREKPPDEKSYRPRCRFGLKGSIMSDGREEREEEKKRRELEELKDREDRLNRDRGEDSAPERGGS